MFEPRRFASIAREISEQLPSDSETRARTAWSRAYYSLFLSVRRAIRESEGRPIHGRDDHLDHGRLRDVLYSTGENDLVALGKFLETLYDMRRQADYVLDPEPRWSDRLKPGKAQRKAKAVEAFIRSDLPKLDFTPLHGQL